MQTITPSTGLARGNVVPRASFAIFAQQSDARIELPAWRRNARQFFGVDLALEPSKTYGEPPPLTDVAEVTLVRSGFPDARRGISLSPRTESDLEAADRAEGGAGLTLLARRCQTVVRLEIDPELSDDAAALVLAAIIASSVLGPIVSPDGRRIFGVRTARAEIDRRVAT